MRLKKSSLIGALAVAASAALAGVGLQLRGARQQIGAIATAYRAAPAAGSSAGSHMAPSLRAGATEDVERAAEGAPDPSAIEPAAPPGAAFDPETAIHVAAQRDAGIDELLNDPDPSVGAAIRDFVHSVEAPGTR